MTFSKDALGEILSYLPEQFQRLKEAREVSGRPVFAIEHDLPAQSLELLKHLIAVRGKHMFCEENWLLWVVYAAEIGYEYDGNEYWQTFEEETSDWGAYGSREKIKEWFFRFGENYRGIVPSGDWANHFRIIAWPITHAIVPRYLQFQFAKSLFELRYELAGLRGQSFESVGAFFSENASSSSTRFGDFLKQKKLVGKIVLALMTHDCVDEAGYLSAKILNRIISDIERQRAAKGWLRQAKKTFIDYKSKNFGVSENDSKGFKEGESVSARREKLFEVFLRRTGPIDWDVDIDFSLLSGAASRHTYLKKMLSASRVRIDCAADSWLPKRWLVFGRPRKPLLKWPQEESPLVRLENGNSEFLEAVGGDCTLAVGEVCVFKTGSDRSEASYIERKVVSPGGEYLLVSKKCLAISGEMLKEINLNCEGVLGYRLVLPGYISNEQIVELENIGLVIRKEIIISPAVVVPQKWTEYGYGEWAFGDSPCFVVRFDFPVEGLKVFLDGELVNSISPPKGETSIYFQIASLPIGSHELLIKAAAASATDFILEETETALNICIKGKSDFLNETTERMGVVFKVDPPDASLDDLWSGGLEPAIYGPDGVMLHVSLDLMGKNGNKLLGAELMNKELPIEDEFFHSSLESVLRKDEWELAYFDADHAVLKASFQGFSDQCIVLEKVYGPVRWSFKREKDDIVARLIDESDDLQPAEISMLNFKSPLVADRIDYEKSLQGFVIDPPGGLLISETRRGGSCVAVSSPHMSGGFKALADKPKINAEGSDIEMIGLICSALKLWGEGNELGPLCYIRKNNAVRGLQEKLHQLVYGEEVFNIERELYKGGVQLKEMDNMIDMVAGSNRMRSYAISLSRHDDVLAASDANVLEWFRDLTVRFGVTDDKALIEAAWLLALNPGSLVQENGKINKKLIIDVVSNRALLMGAWYVVSRCDLLAVDRG